MIKNLLGLKFNKLLVIDRLLSDKNGHTRWKCVCDCGKIINVLGTNLLKYNTTSCGCIKLQKITKHGLYKHTLNRVWRGMKERCCNPNFKQFHRYGGRGIGVCEEWANNFQTFFIWSMSNGWKHGLQIDRIDNDKGYSPDNCRFVTQSENLKNRPPYGN
jgi:hypothetical protein